ncbi:hypothetical protein HHI36_000452 [Cryptolaemus montrouzieri]|uniref:Uncharacterized protein n=1 Tax=Cryptolaemus montrouzieri TaxID=559131 RepID=A0ABD2P4N8_9CUCU
MSRRRRFSASNNYLGLEEAINSIEEDSDDGFEPTGVTDEEEGFDDENLPTNLPNDVPGNIEVFIRHEGASDSSDDEALASKKALYLKLQVAIRQTQRRQYQPILSGVSVIQYTPKLTWNLIPDYCMKVA